MPTCSAQVILDIQPIWMALLIQQNMGTQKSIGNIPIIVSSVILNALNVMGLSISIASNVGTSIISGLEKLSAMKFAGQDNIFLWI